MANNDNRIYDRNLKQWIEVPEDYRIEYDRMRTNLRKRMQSHGRCCCPREKWWLCDTMCDDCEFRRSGDILSLDAPDGEGGPSLLDMLEAEGPRMEEQIADRDMLERLIGRLRELDPEADEMIRLWSEEEKVSDRAMAKALGRPQRTFADQIRRYRQELRSMLK